MSICQSGMDSAVESGKVSVFVPNSHSLILLAQALPWMEMFELIVKDLKETKKGFWWVGRKIKVRIHLALFVLQARLQFTDRQMEELLKYNATYQLFCGKPIVLNWHCPDHTAISKFRARLKPETQRQLLILVVKTAESLGFADSTWMDLDSTVQEANMSYPSDACLMSKLAKIAKKVAGYLQEKASDVLPEGFGVDIEDIARRAKDYFFLAKNTATEKKREVFKELHKSVKAQVYPLIDLLSNADTELLQKMPWNIRSSAQVIMTDAKRYLLDVAHFIRTNSIKSGKILSFHAKDVACIVKGKLGKNFEFGRVFQLGRIGGNFLIPLACNTVRMDDKLSLIPMLKEHVKIFGKGKLKSFGTDKGYYSASNVKAAFKFGVQEIGIQCPSNVKIAVGYRESELAKTLKDRRAGIEPLIGHVKAMGLGRSRMKSDESTLASGYRSVMAFNLRQFERYLVKDVKKVG